MPKSPRSKSVIKKPSFMYRTMVPFRRMAAGARALSARRPHHSFRLTRRRDYRRSLQLPRYWRFTGTVGRTIWRHKGLFLLLTIWYVILSALLVGIASQDTYNQLGDALKSSSQDVVSGNFGPLGQAGLLYLTAITGNLNTQLDAGQQTYAALLGLLAWLTVVWLLRAIMAGQRPRLRDGLYNAGAPIVPTFLLLLVLTVQALPIALAAIGYSAASTTGLLSGGVEAMLFWTAAGLLGALSLYWMTSTFIALVVVTLPGMYPLRALRTAGDLVVGRRLRIMLRLLWMLLVLLMGWTLVMIPVILFDNWLKSVMPGLSWLPLVPWLILIMSGLSLVFSASYIYLLYRKVVDDDATSGTN